MSNPLFIRHVWFSSSIKFLTFLETKAFICHQYTLPFLILWLTIKIITSDQIKSKCNWAQLCACVMKLKAKQSFLMQTVVFYILTAQSSQKYIQCWPKLGNHKVGVFGCGTLFSNSDTMAANYKSTIIKI